MEAIHNPTNSITKRLAATMILKELEARRLMCIYSILCLLLYPIISIISLYIASLVSIALVLYPAINVLKISKRQTDLKKKYMEEIIADAIK